MIKSLGKKHAAPAQSELPVKAVIRFAKSSYIAGDTVSGRLTLTYVPELLSPKRTGNNPPAASLRASAIRLQVSGTERAFTDDGKCDSVPTVHVFRTYTVAGVKDSAEDTEMAHQSLREKEYLRSNARYAPLNGVVLSTEPTDRNASGTIQVRRGDGEFALTTPQSTIGRDDSFLGSSPPRGPTAPMLGGDVVLKANEPYVVPFSFRLPPWLPPSYYCHFADVTASLEYMLQVHLKGLASSTTDEVVLRETFAVISSIPLRQVLQCHERANIKPSFSMRYRFRQFHASSLRRFLSPGPQSPIDVVVEFLSSSTILLRDRNKVLTGMLHPESAASQSVASSNGGGGEGVRRGSEPGSPAVGMTVMGNVVGGGSPETGSLSKRQASDSLSRQSLMTPDPVGCLHLRVTVANGTDTKTIDNTKSGGGTIKTIAIELQSRVTTSAGNRDFISPPFVLARSEVSGSVPLGTSTTFKVKLSLNTSQFRRHKSSGESDLSPPPNISGVHTTVSTHLVLSFAGLKTVPEDVPPGNVVVVAEALDESNRVPYLPNDWRKHEAFTDNHVNDKTYASAA